MLSKLPTILSVIAIISLIVLLKLIPKPTPMEKCEKKARDIAELVGSDVDGEKTQTIIHKYCKDLLNKEEND